MTSGSTALTAAEITQLNRMNEAANRAGLGTVLDDLQDDVAAMESGSVATQAVQITNLSGSANTALSTNNAQTLLINDVSASATTHTTQISNLSGSANSAATAITNLSGSANTALNTNNAQGYLITDVSASALSQASLISDVSASALTQAGQISNLSGSATTALEHMVHSYVHNVSGSDVSGSLVYILTGTNATNAIAVQYYRSGSLMSGINVVSSGSRLMVQPATGGSLVFLDGDYIYWFVS